LRFYTHPINLLDIRRRKWFTSHSIDIFYIDNFKFIWTYVFILRSRWNFNDSG